LLAISALISHNLIIPLFGVKSERTRVLSARLVVLTSGFLAYIIALYGRGICELVLTASSFGTAGILVITMIGLYSRIGGSVAAVSALTAGLVLTPLSRYIKT